MAARIVPARANSALNRDTKRAVSLRSGRVSGAEVGIALKGSGLLVAVEALNTEAEAGDEFTQVHGSGSMARDCGRGALSSRCVMGSALTGVVVLLSSASSAHQPGDEFADWFRSLKVPGIERPLNPVEAFCCSPERDCQTTDYETDAAGLYWIKAEGERIQVPPDKILQRTDNPTGRAVACLRHFKGHPIVRCFVRPPES